MKRTIRYSGYSTDTKPTGVNIGDRFLEIDTRAEYIFAGFNKWNILSAGGGGAGSQGPQGFIGAQLRGAQSCQGNQGLMGRTGNQGPSVVSSVGIPVGSVQFNGNATFSGDANFIFNKNDSSLVIGSSSLSASYSTIFGGYNNTLAYIDIKASSIIGGYKNCICYDIHNSVIIAGSQSNISSSMYDSVIIGGYNNYTNETGCLSTIIGGSNNSTFQSTGGSIIGGLSNIFFDDVIYCDNKSVIIGGYNNSILTNTFNSSIISSSQSKLNGLGNELTAIIDSAIIGGVSNLLCCGVCKSVIIGGQQNIVCCDILNSAIIGSTGSILHSRASNSVIIGGKELILDGDQNTLLSPNISVVGSSDFDISDGGGIQVSSDGGNTYKIGISCNFDTTYTCLCFLNGILVCKLP